MLPSKTQPGDTTAMILVDATDQMRWVTILTLGGVLAAITLAAIGGLPFDVPMPTHHFGWVEPTCGLTRGSTAIVRGDLATAWDYNPASFGVVGFGLVGIVRTLVGAVSHHWVNVVYKPGRVAWTLSTLAFLGLWAYQQSNAPFIIHARI